VTIEPARAQTMVGTKLARIAGVPTRASSVAHILQACGAVVLAGASPAAAQRLVEAHPLRLGEAIALAVRQNPTLAAAGADVGIAEAAVESARGLDDPILQAGASWLETRQALIAGVPLQQPAYDDVSGSVALLKPLSTGGTLGLTLAGDYNRVRYAAESPPLPGTQLSTVEQNVPSLRLSLQHPLLRGFGAAVARAPQRRTRVERDVASAQRAATAAALIRDVVSAYWDAAYAAEELTIRRAAAASARDQLGRVQANIGVGKQPPSASAEVEVAIALRDEAALLAEQALSDRQLELGRLCAVGLELGAGAPRLSPADAPLPAPRRTFDEGATIQAALEGNPQLQAVRGQGRAAAIDVEVTENGLLPELDLSISGGPTGNASQASAAYRQLAGFDGYAVTAQLFFQQALGRHAALGAREAARQSVHKVHLGEADISQQIAGATARGVSAAEVARRRAEVLVHSIDAATLDLEAEKARFEVGRSTNFDVLRRQDALAGVELALLRARADHLKAVAAVDALTGEILDRNGVSLTVR
jgi:outer membrane protein TolC